MKKIALCSLLLLLLIIFFSDVLLFGRTLSTASLLPGATPSGPYEYSGPRPEMPFSFDTGGNAWVNEPNPYIIRRVLNEGGWAAWNPREGLGIPLIANLNSEVFNPLKLFLNLSPSPFSQDIFFLLRLLVMGIFTCLFLREMNLSPASCIFGSSFFMLSGYSVWWINLHPLSTVMYLPAIFYFYERWSNHRDLKSPFLMSLFLCFAFASGKIPDLIMGLSLLFLYAIWKGVVTPPPTPPLKLRGGKGSYDTRRGEGDILGSMFREGGRVLFVVVSGAFMVAIVLLPFLELHSLASPLAKAVRSGAAGHSIPLVTSVSLFQPLFLGWKNYVFGSWLKWTPDMILPHATIVIMLLAFYAALNRRTLIKTLPYFIFSLFLVVMVYGLPLSHALSELPVFRNIEFLKYNGMLYFSLAVTSACAFDDLSSADGSRKRWYLSIAVVSLLILVYFFFLYRQSPSRLNGYMIVVLLLSLSGLFITGLAFHVFKGRQAFVAVVFLFLILELFLYMPRDYPDRGYPYGEPPYRKVMVMGERAPYRITGDGNSLPPLVSNALGLYDIRALSVLLQRDYYFFFEHLLGFSLPGTNNPNPLFTATSPFIDLLGVKYILSREPLEDSRLNEEVSSHIGSLRMVRLFEAMIHHAIRGGVTYGFSGPGSGKRFSLFFPMKFSFETKLKVSEPFLFTGFTLTDVPEGTTAKVKIAVENDVTELVVTNGAWKDLWLDLSRHMGKVITVRLEGSGGGGGRIVLGNFGLSPGHERERRIYDTLLALHKKELDFLKYRGAFDGIHIYENSNVMDRAFVVHKTKAVNSLDGAIRELQEGLDFREMGLVTSPGLSLMREGNEEGLSLHAVAGKSEGDNVVIKKYSPDEIAIDVNSKGGLLVLSDLYYPGWKLKVNGKQQKMVKAFGLLRGVMVGEGKTEILFSYRPVSFFAGLIISVLTFVVWITVFIISGRKDRRRRLIEVQVRQRNGRE